MSAAWFKHHAVQLAISLAAALLVVAHLIWPHANVDAITLGLLAFAVLPWLRGILKGVKLPGGLEITLADAEKVSESIIQPATISIFAEGGEASAGQTKSSEPLSKQTDPNLALVALRIELERRLRALATQAGLESEQPNLRNLVHQLFRRYVLTGETANGIDKLLEWGNAAAHGAIVDRDIAAWAATSGNGILAVLDSLLRR